jgi:hypothetical protein
MADTEKQGTEAETHADYVPGTVDENTHGWAPDAPGTGEAKERVLEGASKVHDANDTQDAATGAAIQGPDMTGGHVGESITTRGEDVVKEEGKEAGRYDGPPMGESQRPTGGTTARDFSGVDPQEPINAPSSESGD